MKRLGFSVVELLVVIGIVTALFSLLAVAVQAARESARRIACVNNMRQLGIAMHDFHGLRGHFPTAAPVKIPYPNSVVLPKREYWAHVSPHFQMLTELGQPTLARTPPSPPLAPGGASVLPNSGLHYTSVISTFLCPSDRVGVGTNYRFCTGDDAHASYLESLREGGHGAFRSDKSVSANEVSRGLSNTTALSERVRSGPGNRFIHESDIWFSGVGQGNPAPTSRYLAAAEAAIRYPPAQFERQAGHSWIDCSFSFTIYNHTLPPNAQLVSLVGGVVPIGRRKPRHLSVGGLISATSFHKGGVNCLAMDASTSFTSDSIDIEVWKDIAVVEKP